MSSSVKNGVAVGYFGCNRFLMVLLSNTSGVNLCRECNYLMARKPLELVQILKFSGMRNDVSRALLPDESWRFRA